MSTTIPQVYKSIPPTSDTNYWKQTLNEQKTQAFSPIDKELHRELLIKQRQQKSIQKMGTKQWRQSISGIAPK